MSADDNLTENSEIDDPADTQAMVSKRPDNRWEARAEAAATRKPTAGEPSADEPSADEPTDSAETDDAPAPAPTREEIAVKNSPTREAMAAKGAGGDPTQPPPSLTVAVSILSYIIGVLVGWGAGSWLSGDPWPVAFAGVIGGVAGFLVGRGILRGVYALRG